MNEVTYGDPGGDPEGIQGGSDLQNGGSWLNSGEKHVGNGGDPVRPLSLFKILKGR